MPDVSIDEIITNSFKNYHVKGFDYICVRRSPAETVKLYFFDGDVSTLPEIVNPHDHRYDFSTLCVTGSVENIWFSRDSAGRPGEVFTRFDYRTPLLGGSGFTFSGTERLAINGRQIIRPGGDYWMNHEEVHTIRMVENETVIALVQFEDAIRNCVPTSTWTRDREPPSLDGLYSKFTADEVFDKLVALKRRAPGLVLPRIV